MNALTQQLVDLVDVLNLEPSDSELSIEFFDRAVIAGIETGLLNDGEADALAGYLNEVAA